MEFPTNLRASQIHRLAEARVALLLRDRQDHLVVVQTPGFVIPSASRPQVHCFSSRFLMMFI